MRVAEKRSWNWEAALELEELKILAARGPEERKRYLDALEDRYGEELKAGNATARRLLMDLSNSHGSWPRTPLAKEFFERLLPLLPKTDQELFLKEMLQDARLNAHRRLEEGWSWWRRLWQRV